MEYRPIKAASPVRLKVIHSSRRLKGMFCGTALLASALMISTVHGVCPFAISTSSPPAAPFDGLAFARVARGAQNDPIGTSHIAKNLARLDMNADGRYDATDALIALRTMLGFRDASLVDGLSVNGTRSGTTEIQAFIDSGCVPDAAMQATWASTTFTESNADFANPERGFWVFLSSDFATLNQGTINYFRQTYPNVTLGYALVRLDAYRDVDVLPSSLFDAVNASFAKVRASGMKLLLRFAYNSPAGEPNPVIDDAPLARVLGHIAQLAPLVQANADVTYVWQAGFIGAWGEGHGSTNGLDSPANKATIRDALLAVAPANRFVMWRDPKDQITWDAQPGSEADAFGNSRVARMGMYNDCFMSSDTDVGTYSPDVALRATQRSYVAARSAIAPFGGETCNGQPPEQQRRTCTAILAEGAQFHVSYLNRTYYDAFHTQWQTEGCFDTVTKNLGYRWVLNTISAPQIANRSQSISVSVALKNNGWARVYNPRALQIRLIARNSPASPPIVISTSWDPRALKPGDTANVLFSGLIPANAALGIYDVVIAAPDVSSSIAANGAYAIRFANSDDVLASQSWDVARSGFVTGLAVTLQ